MSLWAELLHVVGLLCTCVIDAIWLQVLDLFYYNFCIVNVSNQSFKSKFQIKVSNQLNYYFSPSRVVMQIKLLGRLLLLQSYLLIIMTVVL